MKLEARVDPVTRYVHLSYAVPAEAPEEITVRCEWRPEEAADWRPAAVWPHMSDTARQLMPEEDWNAGALQGRVTERRASGRVRTVIWNGGRVAPGRAQVSFRVSLEAEGRVLESGETGLELDNADVVLVEDWSRVLQGDRVTEESRPGQAAWWYRRGQEGASAPRGGSSLEVAEKGVELPPLAYPLALEGYWAIFVALPPKLGCMELRLSGDERTDFFQGHRPGGETFWRWAQMDRQHLILRQPWRSVHEYEEDYRAHLDYVRLVPLSPELVAELEEQWSAPEPHKLVVGYDEPYTWAFYEKVESNLQHREPLLCFQEARVGHVDIQVGRGGAKSFYETRVGTPQVTPTTGDEVRGKVPQTDNVARMVQLTNPLGSRLREARALGLRAYANLGATSCYTGSLLEGEFSQQHPDWKIEHCLDYERPEVRAYVLAQFEEMLQIGAEGLSVDWCRYPYSVRRGETVTGFFRELRALADRYGEERGGRVELLTRFPVRGVPHAEYMDYRTWAREGLIDYLCPSGIQGRHLNFPLDEYLDAVRGTKTKLLPCAEALVWGLTFPGMWLERVRECYAAGADGVYIYQCDTRIQTSVDDRRAVSLAVSPGALGRWSQREEAEQSRYSKGLYVMPAWDDGVYRPWVRLRVWVEGLRPEVVELWVDGTLVNRYERPPYVLGSEEHADDGLIAPGEHVVRVRAREGETWLEREFVVRFEGEPA